MASSIISNRASLAAISTLRSIDSSMEKTQRSIASGYRNANASDNAAYWSIATTMRSDNKALSTVKDALALGTALTESSYSNLSAAVDVISEVKAKLVVAREPGVDRNKINSELVQLKAQLVSITESSYAFNQSLIFDNEASEFNIVEMVGSFVRNSDGNVKVTAINYNTDNSTLIDNYGAANGILTRPNTVTQPSGAVEDWYLIKGQIGVSGREIVLDDGVTNDELSGMIQAVDTMAGYIADAAAVMGAAMKRLEMQAKFTDDLMDAVDIGVGHLVDADMNEESTRLKALQTQQQLGIQSLSIANSTSDRILQLFR